MPKETMPTTIPAHVLRARLDSILEEAAERRARFVITRSGKPAAVLLGVTDLDDILEKLDPEFQRSLRVAARQYRAGRAITLRDYRRERLASRRAG